MASNYGTSRPSTPPQKQGGSNPQVIPEPVASAPAQPAVEQQVTDQQPQVVYVQQPPEKKNHTGCLVAIIVLLGLLLMISMCSKSGSSSSNSRPTRPVASQTSDSGDESTSDETDSSDTEAEVSETIEYQDVTLDELRDALDKNPINAKKKYEGMDVRISGVLSNIDASGDYFTIDDGELLSLKGVHCNVKNQETLDKLMELSMDETITVCGVISDVGEVLGYYCDVDYIE